MNQKLEINKNQIIKLICRRKLKNKGNKWDEVNICTGQLKAQCVCLCVWLCVCVCVSMFQAVIDRGNQMNRKWRLKKSKEANQNETRLNLNIAAAKQILPNRNRKPSFFSVYWIFFISMFFQILNLILSLCCLCVLLTVSAAILPFFTFYFIITVINWAMFLIFYFCAQKCWFYQNNFYCRLVF